MNFLMIISWTRNSSGVKKTHSVCENTEAQYYSPSSWFETSTKIVSKEEAEDISNLLFAEGMINLVVKWTNVKINECRMKYSDQNRHELMDTNEIEINVFLGILFYSAVFR
ncbi:hypothetical protein AVEN_254174-1 [Araneus ventricosus]|uniref:PiggyBac transposable element-derived protein domain-containing protein n=1 Tax=Araneus ventricosus TaxID=182803 RepID=A0A4Y2Q1P5_ARAVE|nr:hypothetical protein AVEN_254174-1 [Araneus ventricosus]